MPRGVKCSYHFKVSEGAKGEPGIYLEPRDSPPELKDFIFIFDVGKGTSIQRANEIAKYLNDNLGDLYVTLP